MCQGRPRRKAYAIQFSPNQNAAKFVVLGDSNVFLNYRKELVRNSHQLNLVFCLFYFSLFCYFFTVGLGCWDQARDFKLSM